MKRLIVALFWMLIASRADGADPRTQTVLFLGDKGPVVFAFDITVGGEPFTESWRKGLTGIVSELDKDGDGFLSREETDQPAEQEASAPSHQPAVAEKKTDRKPLKPPLLQTANLWEADAEPRDGKLSIEELVWFLSRQGQGPFQTEASKETGAAYSPQVTMTNNSGQRLWEWLDQDKDSQLNTEELRKAHVNLRKHDLDSDETISLNELEGVENPFFSARQSNQNTETPFFAVLRERSATPLVRQLIQRYAKLNKPDDEKAAFPGLRVETLGIPESQRSEFDRDGNGWLDEFELRAYLKSPVPMVRIGVQIPDSERGEPLVTGTLAEEKSAIVLKKSTAGSVSVMLGEIQIEIAASGAGPETWMQALEERFKQSDIDNNGYLDQNESRRDVFFRNYFETYDADGDEKLYPAEWKPPVAAAIRLAGLQTRMVVENAGKDLFTVLDSDRNLKISPREWQTAADRLLVWDKNENGTLDRSEVPHVYRVFFGPGLPDLAILTSNNSSPQNPSVQQMFKGPKWFQAMDKNADGDVSAREFLGRPEQFRQIDRDQNNLIDPQEAGRFSE